jgi:acetolactate synthase-1/2/3 large subunit
MLRIRPRPWENRESAFGGCILRQRPQRSAFAQPRPHGASLAKKEVTVTEERSGAQILVESLVRQGVEFVFGYPGGAVLPIYDALFGEERLRHILVRHEAGAAHAAEGYARSTGKPGVVLVTSGPGATNAVTGIADAFLDRFRWWSSPARSARR